MEDAEKKMEVEMEVTKDKESLEERMVIAQVNVSSMKVMLTHDSMLAMTIGDAKSNENGEVADGNNDDSDLFFRSGWPTPWTTWSSGPGSPSLWASWVSSPAVSPRIPSRWI